MKMAEFFQRVVGVADVIDVPPVDSRLPRSLREMYRLNSALPESVLDKDLRILGAERLYKVGEYIVFAEEAQCVVRWAYHDIGDDPACFAITQEDPFEAFMEKFELSGVIFSMLVNNTLSSSYIKHFHYDSLPATVADKMFAKLPIVGGFSNAIAIVHEDVACVVEVDNELTISAGSRSAISLKNFVRLVHELM